MQHYLKTYKKLETIGIANCWAPGRNAVVSQYDDLTLLSALPQIKAKPSRPAAGPRATACTSSSKKRIKSYRFNNFLHARLGLYKAGGRIVGSSLMLVSYDYDVLPPRLCQSKLQLGLSATKLVRHARSRNGNRIDPYHFLGCLFTGPAAKPLFIGSGDIYHGDTTTPHSTLRVFRGIYERTLKTPPYRKSIMILKSYVKARNG